MTVTDLDAEIIIGGTHYESSLIRLERDESLSRPGAEVRLIFSADVDHAAIMPWDDLVIYEQGVLTLTGYVRNIIPKRQPSEVLVTGDDTYKRAEEWFLPENLFTSGSQNIGYWVNYLCDECGLDYEITDSSGSSLLLNPDIPFGLKKIADVLISLCAIAQWQMTVTPAGVLRFQHIDLADEPDYTYNSILGYEFDVNDADTRNAVKVWGYQGGIGGDIIYSETRAVTGVNGVRNMLFAEPAIVTNDQAVQLGNAALNQWAKLARVLSVEVVGNPAIRVGDSVLAQTHFLSSGSMLDTITEMRSTLDMNGYEQSLTAGRRAYRYPHWPVGNIPATNIVILLDNSLKVIYTLNWTSGSPTWIDHSNGLSGTPRQVFFDRSHGFRCFCMTTDGLFRVDDLFGTDDWELIYTPAMVKAALGTASNCEMSGMGIDPRTPGRIIFTAGLVSGATAGPKAIFYSVNGGDFVFTGPYIHGGPGVGGNQEVGTITFGPTSTQGLITFTESNPPPGQIFYDRYARKFLANGEVLGDITFLSNSEVFSVEGIAWHQRSAYNNLILAWSTILSSTYARSTNGGSNWNFFGPLEFKEFGQAVGLHRNTSYALGALTSGSIVRSSNGGQSFSNVNVANPAMNVEALTNLIDSHNNWVIAGSTVKGTTNLGISWVSKVGNLLSIIASPTIKWVDVYNTGVPL